MKQTEADFERQSDLVQRQAVSKATLDKSTRPATTPRRICSRRRSTPRTPQINLGYTKVIAPFDGIVTARQVSVGELVGAASPTQLATIVQLDPIYVNFNVSEQDVLRVREMRGGAA